MFCYTVVEHQRPLIQMVQLRWHVNRLTGNMKINAYCSDSQLHIAILIGMLAGLKQAGHAGFNQDIRPHRPLLVEMS